MPGILRGAGRLRALDARMGLRVGPGGRAGARPADRSADTDQPPVAGKERSADGLGLDGGSERGQVIDRRAGIGEAGRLDDVSRRGRYPQSLIHHHVSGAFGIRGRTFLCLHRPVAVQIGPCEQFFFRTELLDLRRLHRRPVPQGAYRSNECRRPEFTVAGIEIDRDESGPGLHAARREGIDQIALAAEHDRGLGNPAG